MSVDISASRALVTGATGGIGAAIARALHQRGATVLLTGRRSEQLESLSGELGERAETFVADLQGADGVDDLVERAGRVDILVANAGLPASGRYDDFTPEQIDRALNVNLRAPIQLTRALAPKMRERGGGHVVFISSTSGKVATPGSSLYSATKFGMRGFAAGVRADLDGSGVGVTAVFPGFIRDAGMFADSGVRLPPGVGTRRPEDVADAVIAGIERNRAEIDVAPLLLRFGGRLAGAAPGLVAFAVKRGGTDVVDAMAEGQRDKR